ncbi:MAG TPA: type II secretion system F family protein [Gemmatales bacterium]|nr:type II secretion system F family protein [Gemmatales bacterium]HMP60121.1 type II secretion system F family protein [Gemmatales bacterium]
MDLFSPLMQPAVIIPLLAGLCIVTLVLAIGLMANRRGGSAESRLDIFTRKGSKSASSQAIEIWKDAADANKRNLVEQLVPKIPSLDKIFQQAEINIKPSAIIMLSGALAVVSTFASLAFGVPFVIAIIPGIIFGFIPWGWVIWMRNRRLQKFATQMPDAMDLMARALRAGQSLQAAIHVISEEMPSPIATEFGRVYEEQNLGVSLEDAMKSMCERVPSLDLKFFVTSVLIQRQTGGDLAEILDKISYVIRERFKILGMVQALTGEGRLSGNVLVALPFVILLAVMHLNYEYAETLWTTEEGKTMSVYALIMQLLGAWCIRKIVNIKV